jgi:UDP-2,4-diacetamido-2,4,6-trideoxy-beta-L-altropyranose hydrolase
MNLLVRTDASVAIGTGHVMRCLALAQAWQDAGGDAVFAMAEAPPAIQSRLAAESCSALSISAAVGAADDAIQTIAYAQERHADWIVVDGYQFTADYQRTLKAAGFEVLFLDDYGHAAHYAADVVLNQNAHANESMYAAREPYTRLLLGTGYCLLRREFASWRGWKREIARIGRNVLVTVGGSDPENVTAVVVEGLRQVPAIEATIVVGGSNPHFEDLERATSQSGPCFRLQRNVTKMPELMAWADVAVAGAGSTCWELCLLQLPMALIAFADNQRPIAQALEAMGTAIHLGDAEEVTEKKVAQRIITLLSSETERAALSERCGKLVDGRGAERVLRQLTRG